MFGTGSAVASVLPDEGPRRLITGFLFGTTGGLIALSAVGKVSGAHINPVVTMAFWLMRKLDSRTAVGYVLAQLAGGVIVIPLMIFIVVGRARLIIGALQLSRGFRVLRLRSSLQSRLRPSFSSRGAERSDGRRAA